MLSPVYPAGSRQSSINWSPGSSSSPMAGSSSLAASPSSASVFSAQQQQQQGQQQRRSDAGAAARQRTPLRSMRPSGSTGALWTKGSPLPASGALSSSASTKSLHHHQQQQPHQAQQSIIQAADALLRNVERSIEQKEAELNSGVSLVPVTEESSAAVAAAAARDRARRQAAQRLEKKLLRDIEVRHPPSLPSLPTHVNVNARPAAQVYAGSVGRLRNVVEQQPSSFKTMHAHVHTLWKEQAVAAVATAGEDAAAAQKQLEEEEQAAVRSYAADQARKKAAAHSRSASRQMNLPMSGRRSARSNTGSRPGSPSPPPPAAAAAASAHVAAASTAAVPAVAAAALAPMASVKEYNRYSSLRPSVQKEFRTGAGLYSVAAGAAAVNSSGRSRDPSPSTVQAPSLRPSASQPLLPSRVAAAALKSRPGDGLDFAYRGAQDADALHKALVGLPVPLGEVKPNMFEFAYAPPVDPPKARDRVHTPRGTGNLTVQARGYSSAERVSLLVENFRAEQKQIDANLAWLESFRRVYNDEVRESKSLQAKEIFARILEEENERQVQEAEAAAQGLGAQFADEQDRLAAAQRLKPQRVHLSALRKTPGTASAPVLHPPSEREVEEEKRAEAIAARRTGGSNARSRPAAISTSKPSEAASAATAAATGEDTPSPTTPPGFYFAAKLTLNSYNKKRVEKHLGLQRDAHEYDSDDAEWAQGVDSDLDPDEDEEGAAGGGERSQSAGKSNANNTASVATADSDARAHTLKMERMLRDVMANAKAAQALRGAEAVSAALPRRRPGKALNAARFVMANPARKKSRLAPGEKGYARGSGFMSALAEREKAEQARKQKESKSAAQEAAARQAALDAAEAERRRRTSPSRAVSPSRLLTLGLGPLATAAPPADAPMLYTGVEPGWLRSRADYRTEFLPRAGAHLALNSMEKPLAMRSAHESAHILSYLRTLPYLSSFASQPQLQAELLALARLQPAKKGEILFKAGEAGNLIYILVQGSVRTIARPQGPREEDALLPADLKRMMRESKAQAARNAQMDAGSPGMISRVAQLGIAAANANATSPPQQMITVAGKGLGTPGPLAGVGRRGNSASNEHSVMSSPVMGSSGLNTPQWGDDTPGVTPGGHADEEGGATNDGGEDDRAAGDNPSSFLSKRAQQITPGKRAWSAARDRAARALAAATDDHGLSDPSSVVTLLLPGAVFGLSREAAVAREAEESVARAAELYMTAARRRWRRIAESVRVHKGMSSSYHAAELEVEGVRASGGVNGTASARASAARARSRRPNPLAAVARLRTETALCASDDTLLITLAQVDHDRVLQGSIDRARFKQVQALQAMALFQQPSQQVKQQQELMRLHAHSRLGKGSSLHLKAGVATFVSPWRIKHLVQLLPFLQAQSFAPAALIAEEDTLGHILWFVVGGSVSVHKDVEVRTQTRLPAAPGEAQTVMESRRYRRVLVATRVRGDCLAEECVAGAPKLDFTLKAGPQGAELYAIHRPNFLPFWRTQRLEHLKTRVAAARSAAVNYINQLAPELLPGGGGISHDSHAAAAAAAAGAGGELHVPVPSTTAARAHHVSVNMLESVVDDLRGEDDPNLRSPGGRRRHMRPSLRSSTPGSPAVPLRSVTMKDQQRAAVPSPAPSAARTPLAQFKVDPAQSRVWVATAALSPSNAVGGTVAAASVPLPPGLHSSASAGALQPQPSLPEHRPHSPARYGGATRLAARIISPSSSDAQLPRRTGSVTSPNNPAGRKITFRGDGGDAGLAPLSLAGGDASPLELRLQFDELGDDEQQVGSSPLSDAFSSGASSDGSSPAAAGGKGGWGATIGQISQLGSPVSSPVLGSKPSPFTSTAQAAPLSTQATTPALSGDMLLASGLQVSEADVARIRAAQEAHRAAIEAQREAQLAAQAQAARVQRAHPGSSASSAVGSPFASPKRIARALPPAVHVSASASSSSLEPPGHSLASSPISPSPSASTGAATRPSSSSDPHSSSATTITRVLGRAESVEEVLGPANQLHVAFSTFTM